MFQIGYIMYPILFLICLLPFLQSNAIRDLFWMGMHIAVVLYIGDHDSVYMVQNIIFPINFPFVAPKKCSSSPFKCTAYTIFVISPNFTCSFFVISSERDILHCGNRTYTNLLATALLTIFEMCMH